MPAKKMPSGPKSAGPNLSFTLETYGRTIPSSWNQLDIECEFFRRPKGSLYKKKDGTIAGKPRWHHFMRICEMLWGPHNKITQFVWHPWAKKMLIEACRNKRLAVAGCASSGKSDFFAVWAIINFLCWPEPKTITNKDGVAEEVGCMVLVTSTTKAAAANRIWGKVLRYWNGIKGLAQSSNHQIKLPGEVVASSYCIRYVNHANDSRSSLTGIKLVAGEASKAAKSNDEIRGIKGNPLILIGDEFAELSHSLITTFEENLTSNHNHQMIAIANPDTQFDPFGAWCEPENGYESITEDDYEWMSKKGAKVIRFDAELSPNILEGRTIYPFLMREDQLAEAEKNKGGRHSASYYRSVRGFWCPHGHELTIYTPTEFMESKATAKCVWAGETEMVAGLDVAFTNEGDRTVLTYGKVGLRNDGVRTVEYGGHVEIHEDTRVKDVDRTTQIIKKVREECMRLGVTLKNLAVDVTGPGGKAFRDAMIAQWGNEFFGVDFASACSTLPASSIDPTPCNQRYDRKVSEIWYSGKQLLRTDQLRGLQSDLMAEMVLRKYKEGGQGGSDASDKKKTAIETKRDMKSRTKRSPDLADAFFCMLQLCREKHNFVSKEKAANTVNKMGKPNNHPFRKYQDVYAAEYGAA